MLPDGTENPVAKMLLTVLGLGAEIERRNIVSRLNSGRQLAIARGVRMGRPFGSGMSNEKLLQKYPDVVRRLRKGLSVRDTAAACVANGFCASRIAVWHTFCSSLYP